MASKEATVYVIDVGASMGLKRHGRKESDLEWGLKYVWDKIATDVSTGRKGLNTGIVAFRSNETKHDMPEEEAYDHISVLQPIKQLLMPDLKTLQQTLVPSGTDDGDALSALATALQMIIVHCRALKFKKKIVVITNGTGLLDVENLEAFVEQINKDSIDLVILGADFDDLEYGFKEEDKDEQKAANEEVLRKLAEDCNGLFGSLQQAVAELDIPRLKGTRSSRTYQGFLTLGDSSTFESAMAIDVERYARTKLEMPPTARKSVLKSEPGADETQDPGLARTQNLYVYQVTDDQAPGGKRDIEREALAKGYQYGQTVVPVSETDMNVFEMETEAAYDILGFIPTESYPHYMNMETTHFIIPQRSNDKAVLALSSLIHALYELDSHAVARLVLKRNKEPVLVLLSHEINNEFECLYENSLPFFEDVRAYKFPPLDRILTVSGKTLTVHRNLPEPDLQDAMDNLVDKMDLSTYDKDDEGNPTEYLTMDDTYSPIYHRLNQVIKHRAIHPEGPVPPPSAVILGPMRPPNDLLETMKPYLEKLKTSANVKKVPPKTASRKTKRVADQPRSNLDLESILGERVVQREDGKRKITPLNAIPEFKQYCHSTNDLDYVRDAFSQFGPIVESWIKHSFGDSGYERAVEGIAIMRQESIELEEPSLYNDFMKALKQKLLNEELGGDRREMWYKLRKYKLGLVDKGSSSVSEVEAEEAREFLTS